MMRSPSWGGTSGRTSCCRKPAAFSRNCSVVGECPGWPLARFDRHGPVRRDDADERATTAQLHAEPAAVLARLEPHLEGDLRLEGAVLGAGLEDGRVPCRDPDRD